MNEIIRNHEDLNEDIVSHNLDLPEVKVETDFERIIKKGKQWDPQLVTDQTSKLKAQMEVKVSDQIKRENWFKDKYIEP